MFISTMSVQPYIIIVDDEVVVSEIIRDYLTAEGFKARVVNTGLGTADIVRSEKPDLVLLDLVLPEVDGLNVCREIRTFSEVPIVMLTARVDEKTCVIGLEIGADDYICKPVNPSEVVARVRAVLRRVAKLNTQQKKSSLQIDETQRIASWCGQDLDLTPIEIRLLNLFVNSPDRIYSREQLVDSIYLNGHSASNRTIDSHLRNLRRKLIEVSELDNPIRSIYGVGYKLDLG